MATIVRALFTSVPLPLVLPLALLYVIAVQHAQQQAGGGWQAGSTGAPLEYDESLGALSAPLQIAKWPFERNWAHLTEGCEGADCGVEKILIEVGANRRDVLQDEFPGGLAGSKAFVLTFEPLVDKWGWLLQRNAEQDRISPPGRQHRRGLALPMAVGCEGRATFHVPDIDGCSSVLPPSGSKVLLDQQAAATGADGKESLKWKRIVSDLCAETKERRKVPCVGLEEVITGWLGGREIELLKIDAQVSHTNNLHLILTQSSPNPHLILSQGFDLQVVRSAGEAIRRVKTIVLEVQNDGVAKLYQGQPTCSEVSNPRLVLIILASSSPHHHLVLASSCRR